MYEEFTPEQRKLLSRFVTNTEDDVFVLTNLPEVIKGALFSRYSRSSLGLRSLLLKEFIPQEESAFAAIATSHDFDPDQQILAIQRAQDFYDRILDGYGDDSIGELGGAHLAIENISILGAKVIEDCRIGGSFLEKSTRYIYFDQKYREKYLYYREPVLLTSAYKTLYLNTCDALFLTYSNLIPLVTELVEKKFPKEETISKGAYAAALRAKVLDILRGLLPAATMTNVGVYGNGRFWEGMINKLHCHNLAEMQELGGKIFHELSLVIPSFVRRAAIRHKNHLSYAVFMENMSADLSNIAGHHPFPNEYLPASVQLIAWDEGAIAKVAAALLYSYKNVSLETLQHYCATLSEEELAKIFDAAGMMREHRRHKSPRALEHAVFTFEIVGDFGMYRDLQRHRVLTQERQPLSCHFGYYIPEELLSTPMEKEYRDALHRAKDAYDTIAAQFPEEGQYIVPMAYNIRWYFQVNLRELQWLCELRSSPAGHPAYRAVAQEMVQLVLAQFPLFSTFFKFVDYSGYELGRLGQEQRKASKCRE